jgi:hypothetical protein
MISNLLKAFTCLVLVILFGCSEPAEQPFRLFQVSDMVRVFEDGYNLPATRDTISVFGIRGEVVSAQCVFISKNGLSDVSAEIAGLKNTVTGEALPASTVEWNFVGSVPLTKNTPNQPVSALTRPAPAMYPDYLMNENQITVEKGIYQSIWLTFNIPQTAEAGSYAGSITVISPQGTQSLPINLKIYPLNLPAERHLKVVEWYQTGDFERFHGIKEKYSQAWFEMLGKYAENMAAHRQNLFPVPMEAIEIRRTEKGTLAFDFSRFDQIAQVFWNTGKMDYLETGGMGRFGEPGWSSTEILLRDFEVTDIITGERISIEGKEIVPSLLPALESHLRQKGWLDKTLFHVRDEPSLHNALAWRELSAYIHKYAPELIRIDAIETTFLLDEIEIAVPKLDALQSWYESYRKWQQEGNELWFYTVGIYQGSYLPNKTIDMPLMDSRILHWLNYKYDAVGYLHWGWNQWNEDPFQDVGMHIGDGWHVYPDRNGVLNSLRWEQMRNGIQDYEYFRMLEDRIRALKDSLGSGFAWIDPTQRSKEIAGTVVMNLVDHSDDPQLLYKARREVIRELLDFDTSPRIYVQTDPKVNATLTNHSSVAVFGWTEPGTKIVVNGQEIPVSDEGLFLEQFGGEFIDTTKIKLGDRILVQASNQNGSKEIVRDFLIEY